MRAMAGLVPIRQLLVSGRKLTISAHCVVTNGNYSTSLPYFNAKQCFDSTPLNLLTGNRQPGCLCRCSMWARAPRLDSLSACTGPWQCLQRMSLDGTPVVWWIDENEQRKCGSRSLRFG